MPHTHIVERTAKVHRHPFDEDVKVKLALTTWLEQRIATVADDVKSVCEMSGISRVSQNRFGASECAFKHTQRYGEPHENRIMEDTT